MRLSLPWGDKAEVFPNAAVVIDRFHVMKLVLETLNKIRRLLGIKTKGSKYLLLKNHQDLTESEPAQLEQILSQSLFKDGL
jgi:transposase